MTELSSVPRRTHPLSPFAKAGQGLSGLVLAVFIFRALLGSMGH